MPAASYACNCLIKVRAAHILSKPLLVDSVRHSYAVAKPIELPIRNVRDTIVFQALASSLIESSEDSWGPGIEVWQLNGFGNCIAVPNTVHQEWLTQNVCSLYLVQADVF